MRKEFILNKRLNEIFKFETNELMKRRLEKVNSTINVKCPKSFINSKRSQLTNTFANNKSN